MMDDVPLHPSGICQFCLVSGAPDVYTSENRKDFVYERDCGELIPTFVCLACKSTKFFVGRSRYITVIKCPICGWERCIHEG